MNKTLEKLEEVFNLIPEDSDMAQTLLEKTKKGLKPTKDKMVQAKADLLTLMLASHTSTYANEQIDDIALLAFFEKNELYDDAAHLMFAKCRHLHSRVELAEYQKWISYTTENLADKISPITHVTYLINMANLAALKNEYAQRLYLGMQAMEKINAIAEKDSWWYANYIAICCILASVYQRNDQFAESWQHLEDALAIVDSRPVSRENRFLVYRFVAVHYNLQAETQTSALWYDKMLEITRQGKENAPLMISIAINLAAQHSWLYHHTPTNEKKKRAKFFSKLEAYVEEAQRYGKKVPLPYYEAIILFARCRLELIKENYPLIEEMLDRAEQLEKQTNHLPNTYDHHRLRHKLYFGWGMKTGNLEMLAKANEHLQKFSDLLVEDGKKSTQTKLDAVKATYEVQQRKLHEELLQQELNNLNKEMQMTAISLQEKVKLLDDLKMYVLKVKKNNVDSNKQINAILQKIDSVKITEQEKNLLQTKVNANNLHLTKKLTEIHPNLSNLETSMCLLFSAGLNNKELSRLYGQTEKSYEQHRYRIKRKLGLGPKEHLVQYLQQLM